MSDRDDQPLEGEIISPGERDEERMRFRVVKRGWFHRLLLATLALCVIALMLYVSFWVLVFLAPLIAVIIILSLLKRIW